MKHPELVIWKKSYIKSMYKLIDRYQAAIEMGVSKYDYENENDMSCLLCHPVGISDELFKQTKYKPSIYSTQIPHTQCCTNIGCPWIVITGKTCDDVTEIPEKTRGRVSIYQTRNVSRMMARIKQLRSWIKIYEGLLK